MCREELSFPAFRCQRLLLDPSAGAFYTAKRSLASLTMAVLVVTSRKVVAPCMP